ncbi:hypothetical protein TBLA_0B04610 [Henningerozyma blattae CBS 6284]|uniref:AAA+ ATPase domain-containing protein n=1 Tax=Henningerozyma blattae (strain ATCC 34711 / CBS 6284 / DSM 70876 / NBRC 10599 / NRRL Y-10934 / UCD 77-7) TaxID=1071380 RepID=I2GYU5_HENB6|nr:hypothetical protein TBLA_0B04610 [Tetrapisispora blattae CBS 6284]CCH59297.1 hypothetical protein TBLA_0B04610 [Tetrapisispora blattae CBS 6284]
MGQGRFNIPTNFTLYQSLKLLNDILLNQYNNSYKEVDSMKKTHISYNSIPAWNLMLKELMNWNDYYNDGMDLIEDYFNFKSKVIDDSSISEEIKKLLDEFIILNYNIFNLKKEINNKIDSIRKENAKNDKLGFLKMKISNSNSIFQSKRERLKMERQRKQDEMNSIEAVKILQTVNLQQALPMSDFLSNEGFPNELPSYDDLHSRTDRERDLEHELIQHVQLEQTRLAREIDEQERMEREHAEQRRADLLIFEQQISQGQNGDIMQTQQELLVHDRIPSIQIPLQQVESRNNEEQRARELTEQAKQRQILMDEELARQLEDEERLLANNQQHFDITSGLELDAVTLVNNSTNSLNINHSSNISDYPTCFLSMNDTFGESSTNANEDHDNVYFQNTNEDLDNDSLLYEPIKSPQLNITHSGSPSGNTQNSSSRNTSQNNSNRNSRTTSQYKFLQDAHQTREYFGTVEANRNPSFENDEQLSLSRSQITEIEEGDVTLDDELNSMSPDSIGDTILPETHRKMKIQNEQNEEEESGTSKRREAKKIDRIEKERMKQKKADEEWRQRIELTQLQEKKREKENGKLNQKRYNRVNSVTLEGNKISRLNSGDIQRRYSDNISSSLENNTSSSLENNDTFYHEPQINRKTKKNNTWSNPFNKKESTGKEGEYKKIPLSQLNLRESYTNGNSNSKTSRNKVKLQKENKSNEAVNIAAQLAWESFTDDNRVPNEEEGSMPIRQMRTNQSDPLSNRERYSNGMRPNHNKNSIQSANISPVLSYSNSSNSSGNLLRTQPKKHTSVRNANTTTKKKKKVVKKHQPSSYNTKRISKVMSELDGGIDKDSCEQIINEILVSNENLHWDDIAGLNSAKQALREAVEYPFLRPDLFKGLREPTRGMLLFGPPGTGKTMIAKTVASESQSTFFSISASSLLSKYLGESEKLVRALFYLAVRLAPSIIFIDEIDSLLTARGDNENETGRRIKTELLIQWSKLSQNPGSSKDSEVDNRVLLLGATNLPWAIDEAARRRFSRRLYIPLPDLETRIHHLKKLMSRQEHQLREKDFTAVGKLTEGYSGSDLTALAKEAAMMPLRDLGHSLLHVDFASIRPVGISDFVLALETIRGSVSASSLQQYSQWSARYGSTGS